MVVLLARVVVVGGHLIDPGAAIRPRYSIIIPLLNELEHIDAHLDLLFDQLAIQGNVSSKSESTFELIYVDGESDDGSYQKLMHRVQSLEEQPVSDQLANFKVLSCKKGRARQMNVGASEAQGEVLVFLHIDTTLPANCLALLDEVTRGASWLRFDLAFDEPGVLFRGLAWMINTRSGLSGIATGDQTFVIEKSLFLSVGGFPDQPLMEDVELSKRLKALVKPKRITPPVMTSARKWKKEGLVRTILLMWKLRWQYSRGVKAETLVKTYYPGRSYD